MRKSIMSMVAFQTITAAGTPEAAVASSEYADQIIFENPKTQGGVIYLADSSANAMGTQRFTLQPGERLVVEGTDMGSGDVEPFDIADWWVDASVSGEGVVISKVVRSGQIADQF